MFQCLEKLNIIHPGNTVQLLQKSNFLRSARLLMLVRQAIIVPCSLSLTRSINIPYFQVIWNILCFQIRYIGLSNETPYGVMKFAHINERYPHIPKVVSLQVLEVNILRLILFFIFIATKWNISTLKYSYNLLCRTFDSGLAECCHHER